MRHAICAVVLVGLALSTAARVALWSGPEVRLWQEATERAPLKVRPWVNLGNQYTAIGQFERAERAYLTAIDASHNPARGWDERIVGRALAEVNLGILDIRLGRTAEGKTWIHEGQARFYRSGQLQEVAKWASAFP